MSSIIKTRVGLLGRESGFNVSTFDEFQSPELSNSEEPSILILSDTLGDQTLSEKGLDQIRSKFSSSKIVVAFNRAEAPEWFRKDSNIHVWLKPHRVRDFRQVISESAQQTRSLGETASFPFKKKDPETTFVDLKKIKSNTKKPFSEPNYRPQPKYIVGESASIRAVYSSLRTLSRDQTSFILTGETDCEFEFCAREIHEFSDTKQEALFPTVYDEYDFDVSICGDIKKEAENAKGKVSIVLLKNVQNFDDAQWAIMENLLQYASEPENKLRIIVSLITSGSDEPTDHRFESLNIPKISIPALSSRPEDIPYVARNALYQLCSIYPQARARAIDDEALEHISKQEYAARTDTLFQSMQRAFLICAERKLQTKHFAH
ncbi:MAG: hypothetical protein ACPGN3_17280 [Opitutales bacterium]